MVTWICNDRTAYDPIRSRKRVDYDVPKGEKKQETKYVSDTEDNVLETDDCAIHGVSTLETTAGSNHPLADLFGKYEGDIWDEVLEGLDRVRAEEDFAASPE